MRTHWEQTKKQNMTPTPKTQKKITKLGGTYCGGDLLFFSFLFLPQIRIVPVATLGFQCHPIGWTASRNSCRASDWLQLPISFKIKEKIKIGSTESITGAEKDERQ